MTCSRCGQESPADARFCVGCGSPLRAGAEPPELQPSEPHGERLAPRDVGALVGAAFTLYRENFASLVTIALPPQVTLYLSAVSSSAVSWALLAISLIGYLLAYAAIVFAAAQRLVEPAIDLGLCLSRTRERAKPLIGANLILAVGLTASALLAFLIVGVPLFVFILVRWFFLAPAIMIEGRDAMGALRRSSTLVEGSWWRGCSVSAWYSCW